MELLHAYNPVDPHEMKPGWVYSIHLFDMPYEMIAVFDSYFWNNQLRFGRFKVQTINGVPHMRKRKPLCFAISNLHTVRMKI